MTINFEISCKAWRRSKILIFSVFEEIIMRRTKILVSATLLTGSDLGGHGVEGLQHPQIIGTFIHDKQGGDTLCYNCPNNRVPSKIRLCTPHTDAPYVKTSQNAPIANHRCYSPYRASHTIISHHHAYIGPLWHFGAGFGPI